MHIDKNRGELNADSGQQRSRCNIKLHLHIGTEKTGTTSFQHWMMKEHTALEAKGIIQPDWPQKFVLGGANRMLAVYAQGYMPNDDGQKPLGFTSQAQYDALCDGFVPALAAEIKRRADGVWIFSGEHMHSRLVSVGQVQRLAALLQPHFSEIIVHIHLRPQVDMARSIASTFTRLGMPVTERNFDKVNPDSTYYNFSALVTRWEAVFGAAQVRVIPYKRVRSIRQYFLDLWQLDAADFGPELNVNGAVDWRTMALVNTMFPHRGLMPEKSGLQKIIAALPAKDTLQIGHARAKEITERMRASNEALVRARPELTMADLTPDWEAYDQPENLARVTAGCEFSAQMVTVMSELQGELILEKARTNVLQAEKFLGLGKKGRAHVKLEKASALLLTIEPAWENRSEFVKLRNFMSKVILDDLE